MWALWSGQPKPKRSSEAFPRKILDAFRNVTTGLPPSWTHNTPIDQWHDVIVRETDTLELKLQGIVGSVEFSKLPPSTTQLSLRGTPEGKIVGRLANLPSSLTRLFLSGNRMTGAVDLTCLPSGLEVLCLSSNKFSGEVVLTALPSSMFHLDLSQNAFTGIVDLTQLPVKMTQLYIQQNDFRGAVDLSRLPPSMETVYLRDNHFTGSLETCTFPLSLFVLDLRGNLFTGVPPKGSHSLDLRLDERLVEQ